MNIFITFALAIVDITSTVTLNEFAKTQMRTDLTDFFPTLTKSKSKWTRIL